MREIQEHFSPAIPRVNQFSKAFLYTAIFFAIHLGAAQEAIQGVIPDWNFGAGDVITGFQEPRKIGAVSAEGKFTIPLTPNFIEKEKRKSRKTARFPLQTRRVLLWTWTGSLEEGEGQ